MVTKTEEKLINLRLTQSIEPEEFAIIRAILNEHANARVYQANCPWQDGKEWRFQYQTKVKIGREKTLRTVKAIVSFELNKNKVSKNKFENNIRWKYRQIQIDDDIKIKDQRQSKIGYIPDYRINGFRVYDFDVNDIATLQKRFKEYEKSLFLNAKQLTKEYNKEEARRIAQEEKRKNDIAALKVNLFTKHNISGAQAEKLFEIIVEQMGEWGSTGAMETTFERYVDVLKV